MGKKPLKIVVIGAGPVGSLAALYAARRGYEVEVYDLRDDIRTHDSVPQNVSKSINLALSERGINSLRLSGREGLLDTILSRTIPMHSRMIHVRSTTGNLVEQSQVYDVHGNVLHSVDRGELNTCLLNELDRLPNVTLFFKHKLTGADFKRKKAWLEDQNAPVSGTRRKEFEISFHLMLGCDGAHSAVRFHMMKFALVNYTQEYIDCLWCEFLMSPSSSGDYRISPNHLHIWPAGSFMFIALPNLDKSFACTLFGPVSLFKTLESSPQTLISTFNTHFPGVTSLISESDLTTQFKNNPHLPLISIKCSPHHYNSSVAILGDSAHAMVPFYGQGMNCGLESVRVFFDALDAHPDDFPSALSSYTATRTEDAHAIASLALGNYEEMRAGVTSRVYKARKAIEELLHKWAPGLGWSTQYSRVSFSNLPYSRVIKQSEFQKRVLLAVFTGVGGILGGGLGYAALLVARRRRWL